MMATYRLIGLDGEATEVVIGVDDLADPDAPPSTQSMSLEAQERLLEKEYGLTRLVTEGRGVLVMIRSIQRVVGETLRQIRRDEVDCKGGVGLSPARQAFTIQPPCPGLQLLRHCVQLPSNRRKILRARAPTALLTLLLEVLQSLEGPASDGESINSPTAQALQELIEILTSDISANVGDGNHDPYETVDEGYATNLSSMPLMLESIETSSLNSALQNVIAKLLPYLTYG